MIFSKDKKPTEPGWYWFKYEDTEPEIILIEDRGWGLRSFWTESGTDHDLPDGLWGDRIETPTVETPKGKGGADAHND